ncbi:protein of unknown function [Cupriavidus taiwanensis]|uniref:Uncharacterized protein n=1 Tax=Cupriavidus taiwanensis TaxID=164546 RepID=A0A375IHA0_9BURK|nr:protein of unknown function [Cupriavidus taiwanensis]
MIEQVAVDLRVHFTLEDLLGTLDGQHGNLVAQFFASTGNLLISIGLGLGNDACGFCLGVLLDLVGRQLSALLGVSDALSAFGAGFGHGLVHTLVGEFKLGLALLGSGEAIGDLRCAFVERLHQRRPNEFGNNPPQDEEHDHLRKKRCVQIHGVFLSVIKLQINAQKAARLVARAARQHHADRKELLDDSQQRVGEGEQHRNTHADQECRVDQAGQQEHLGLQRVHQFRLTCAGFDVLAAHQGDTQAGADSAQADDDTDTDGGQTLDVGEKFLHDDSFNLERLRTKKPKTKKPKTLNLR